MQRDSVKQVSALNNQQTTYKNLVDDAKALLYEHCDTPRIDAEILIGHVTKQSLSWLISYGDSIASADHIKQFYQLVSERQAGQPIAYLIGERDFWTLSLSVDSNVLIPRPDTETLVEAALPLITNTADTSVLDLGTGSGAIALSIAKELPKANITAVDVHNNALNVAKKNAVKNNISNVSFVQSNWFESLDDSLQFDLIASNPPYIEPNDPHLNQGDLRFEPTTALVAQENGLADLSNIIQTAPEFLKDNGWLIVEHGYNQASAVDSLFKQYGFTKISLHKDLNNLARCTLGQLIC